MSDTSPKDQNALLPGHRAPASGRQPRPRELLFVFVDARQRPCRAELMDDGFVGLEATVSTDDALFFSSRRFSSRAIAEQWAHDQRRLLERR